MLCGGWVKLNGVSWVDGFRGYRLLNCSIFFFYCHRMTRTKTTYSKTLFANLLNIQILQLLYPSRCV